MQFELRGSAALVTGAARGIGLAVAEDLARAGVNICGTDIRTDTLSTEMDRIAKQHAVKTLAITADVGVESEVVKMVSQAYSTWDNLDILINNAGVRKIAPVYETTEQVWDYIHASNLKGQYLCTKEVLRQGMLQRNQGVIIFISSGSGIRGEKGSAAYCASKFGVTGLAESVAKDLQHTGIRTTTIMPGMIWTPMAEESEMADKDVQWLDVKHVSKAVLFAIQQDADTIIPELRIYHRSQI